MFKLIISTRSKLIHVTGPAYKQSYKLTGFGSVAVALKAVYEAKGLIPGDCMEVARVLFGDDNPVSYEADGLQFTKIKNGYLIAKQ